MPGETYGPRTPRNSLSLILMSDCWENAPAKSRKKNVLRWKYGVEGTFHVGTATYRNKCEWGWLGLDSASFFRLSGIWLRQFGKVSLKSEKWGPLGYRRRYKKGAQRACRGNKSRSGCSRRNLGVSGFQQRFPSRWLHVTWGEFGAGLDVEVKNTRNWHLFEFEFVCDGDRRSWYTCLVH